MSRYKQHNQAGDVKILLVEDDQALGELLYQEIVDHDFVVRLVRDAEQALQLIHDWQPDLVISDLRLPGKDGLSLLRSVHGEAADHAPDFLMITAFGSIATAVECLKAGAVDFLTKPLDLDHFMLSVRRILENRGLRHEMSRIKSLLSEDNVHGMIGQSRPMRMLYAQIGRIAMADGPVLILGESGTGKELVAKAVHAASGHDNGSFLAVNCAGIPEQLLESEFFGHKAGAFSGAAKARRGLFAEAEGGTLFLDEISEMPLALQAKLLRMLQDGKIRPVGADREEQINVRTVAATHRDLEQEVRAGNFREDLFFRLETFTLEIPPLRERGDDLDLLASRFVRQFSIQTQKPVEGLHEQTLERLRNYRFPGNVRELKNAMERAVTFCDGKVILPQHLPARIRHTPAADAPGPGVCPHIPPQGNAELPTLSQAEHTYIQHVLRQVGGNKRRAAGILGICRRTLYRKLEQFGPEQGAEQGVRQEGRHEARELEPG